MPTESELQKKSVKKVITDSQHTEMHSLKDQIEYDKYQTAKERAVTAKSPFGQFAFKPSGTV